MPMSRSIPSHTWAPGMKNHFDSIEQVNNLREIQVGEAVGES